jgi:hypothetical protein
MKFCWVLEYRSEVSTEYRSMNTAAVATSRLGADLVCAEAALAMSEDAAAAAPPPAIVRELRNKYSMDAVSAPSKSKKKSTVGVVLDDGTLGLVTMVIPGGPSHRKIQKGDIICLLDGQVVTRDNFIPLLGGLCISAHFHSLQASLAERSLMKVHSQERTRWIRSFRSGSGVDRSR